MSEEVAYKRIQITSRHHLTMASVITVSVWVVSVTYFFLGYVQISPLQSKASSLSARLQRVSAEAEIYDERIKNLRMSYLLLLQEHDKPITLEPRNEADLVGSQINFEWDYRLHNGSQRYILEIVSLDSRKTYRFNVTNPDLKSMYLPVKNVGYGEFLWRIIPGHRSGDVELTEGSSSNFSLFRVFPSVWKKVLQKRVLVVGTSPDMSSKFNRETADNKVIGFDIDLMEWIVSEINLKLKLVPPIKLTFSRLPMSKILPKLREREVDLAISSLTATKEWERKYNVVFSEGYFRTDEVFVTKNKMVGNFPDGLQGKLVGAVLGSINERSARFLAEKYGYNVVSHYLTRTQLYRALDNNNVDLVVTDKIHVFSELSNNRFDTYGPDLLSLLSGFYRENYGRKNNVYSIALHHDREDELLLMINEILKSNEGRNELELLERKWISPRVVQN
ncbi:ABC-type amino acid transport substrate-binding protein [Sinobacterium caligoides]|uniref:ABC-type amino acid transport substrate-binding protein n=1 Tax=Sinobacterium caligoides TaxID=933926 RepID=A0A3N2DZL9_9GAMM|nr:transporter substrate-binding domain-containing protein [Sinobacterium caligoides]ROS04879.1 ABC-type amino acid transport substrate-binding protein [Sinobacterium caligoides]